MDIPALSTIMSNTNLAVQVSTSILSMNQELMKQQGQALTSLISSSALSATGLENSVTPYLGGSIDLKI